MKLFTFKDIIKYNNPCKSCGTNTRFKYCIHNPSTPHTVGHNPTVRNGKLYFSLLNKYKFSMGMAVDAFTHKFTIDCTNPDKQDVFSEFVSSNTIDLHLSCDKCKTFVKSKMLEFNGDIVKPIAIAHENILIEDGEYRYLLSTAFDTNKTVLSVFTKNQASSPLEFTKIPLYKFRSREDLLKKIKFLLAFS